MSFHYSGYGFSEEDHGNGGGNIYDLSDEFDSKVDSSFDDEDDDDCTIFDEMNRSGMYEQKRWSELIGLPAEIEILLRKYDIISKFPRIDDLFEELVKKLEKRVRALKQKKIAEIEDFIKNSALPMTTITGKIPDRPFMLTLDAQYITMRTFDPAKLSSRDKALYDYLIANNCNVEFSFCEYSGDFYWYNFKTNEFLEGPRLVSHPNILIGGYTNDNDDIEVWPAYSVFIVE